MPSLWDKVESFFTGKETKSTREEKAKKEQWYKDNPYQQASGQMKAGDYNNPLYTQLFETYFKQYGDHNRAERAAMTAYDYYAKQSTGLDTFNQGVGASEGYLNQILSGNNPLKVRQEQQLQSQVGRLQQKGTKNILNQLSQSGMSRSGAGYGALNELYGESANTLTQGQLGIDLQDQTQKSDAVAKLLGIQGTRAGLAQGDKNYMLELLNSYAKQQGTGGDPGNGQGTAATAAGIAQIITQIIAAL